MVVVDRLACRVLLEMVHFEAVLVGAVGATSGLVKGRHQKRLLLRLVLADGVRSAGERRASNDNASF